MPDEKVKLMIEQAIGMISKDDRIHTFRQTGPILLGCDWNRKDIITAFEKYPPELSGSQATSMKHGLVLEDETGYLFIETVENNPKTKEEY